MIQSVLQALFAPCLRACIFQVQELRHNCWARCLIPTYVCRKQLISEERVAFSATVLTGLTGAEIQSVQTTDGESDIECLVLERKQFVAKIEALQGEVTCVRASMDAGGNYCPDLEGDFYLYGILAPAEPSEDWEEFDSHVLSKMGWEKISLTKGKKAHSMFLFDRLGEKDGNLPQKLLDRRLGFINCLSPDRLLTFHRGFVGHFLPYGDVCLFNHRPERPYESTQYDDVETAYKRFAQKCALSASQIYPAGFCHGATLAAHLKMAHHNEQMGAILIHPSPSLDELIPHQATRVGYWLAKYALAALRRGDERENGFNLLGYFDGAEENDSQLITVETDSDHFVVPGSGERITEAAATVCRSYLFTHHGIGKDGHHEDPCADPKVKVPLLRCLTDGPVVAKDESQSLLEDD
jgi:predicted esterase